MSEAGLIEFTLRDPAVGTCAGHCSQVHFVLPRHPADSWRRQNAHVLHEQAKEVRGWACCTA